jgi:Na+-translocating ferredoxin:NAD+ oxidoreductase RNF subunit RnfB
MITTFLFSVVSLGALGLFAGLFLAFAHQKFKVEEDPRVEKIDKLLPGANCGACGMPGCRGFAEAVVEERIDPAGCLLGGDETAKLVSWIMGVEKKEREKQVAVCICGGGKENSFTSFDYAGVETCVASDQLGGGFKACAYGCLGFADCEVVCPVDAITMSDNKLPVVDFGKCIGCEKCVRACPRDLFVMVPYKPTLYLINCNSKDKGAVSRKVCKNSCIACRICEKKCPTQAITIADNLAIIDQSKCIQCDACFAACPTKAISCYKKRAALPSEAGSEARAKMSV